MRTMYDSVTARNIPADAAIVAGYANGVYAWSDADWARFPNAVKVGISVGVDGPEADRGQVLDVERSDATPDQAPDWCVKARARGVDPTVYCSLSVWATVKKAFDQQNVPYPHWWIAAYDGVPAIPQGAVAHQYEDAGPYDLSVVADYWPGVDPEPTTERDMAFGKYVKYSPHQATPDHFVWVNPQGQLVLDSAPWGAGNSGVCKLANGSPISGFDPKDPGLEVEPLAEQLHVWGRTPGGQRVHYIYNLNNQPVWNGAAG